MTLADLTTAELLRLRGAFQQESLSDLLILKGVNAEIDQRESEDPDEIIDALSAELGDRDKEIERLKGIVLEYVGEIEELKQELAKKGNVETRIERALQR